MKKIIYFCVFTLILNTALARIGDEEFHGWDNVVNNSSDVVIARCTSTYDPSRGKWVVIQDNIIASEVEITSVLKGNAQIGAAHLLSSYWPHPGDQLLLFANYRKDNLFTGFQAAESYRVVPLNRDFQTNMLGGTNLQQQIRWVLEKRLQTLNEELEKGQAEKRRLEEGLKELK